MAQLNTLPRFGKKQSFGFADQIGMEKHERIARSSLHDLLLFHQTLEDEMRTMLANAEKGETLDRELLDLMLAAKEKYQNVMQGLREFDDVRERHALIAFADAVQDLMSYSYKRRH